MKTLVNLTPHTIRVGMLSVPASGAVARVSMDRQNIEQIEVGGAIINLDSVTFGEIKDLPDPEVDTYFIVSALVRQALPERLDLVSPGRLVRNAEGDIIGAECLDVNVRAPHVSTRVPWKAEIFWVSVDKRLPNFPDEDDVVATCECKNGYRWTQKASYDKGIWYQDRDECQEFPDDVRVVAWARFPAPPPRSLA